MTLRTIIAATVITVAASTASAQTAGSTPDIIIRPLYPWDLRYVLQWWNATQPTRAYNDMLRRATLPGWHITYYRGGWHHENHPNRGSNTMYDITDRKPWRRHGVQAAVFCNPTPKD